MFAEIVTSSIQKANKGVQTRASIVAAAMHVAGRDGLKGITIGGVADRINMSKSGVFAHFGSREDLQIAVVEKYHEDFEAQVFLPAMQAARGVARVNALFSQWIERVGQEIDSGCIYISGAVEFDEHPGAVRDALVTMVQTWQAAVARAVKLAQTLGHLSDAVAPEQIAFELHGIVLAVHHDARFLKLQGSTDRAQTAFNRLIKFYTV